MTVIYTKTWKYVGRVTNQSIKKRVDYTLQKYCTFFYDIDGNYGAIICCFYFLRDSVMCFSINYKKRRWSDNL